MKKRNNNSKEGFTIIEVVLVLAIAGLIFLMVFVALPALQRSQRDTQRRNDMGRLITAIQNYQSNNRNKVPNTQSEFASGSTFYEGYLTTNGDSFADPSSNSNYVFSFKGSCKDGCSDPETTTGTISVYTNATCAGDHAEYSQGDGKLAFTIKLEGSTFYCSNN